MGYCTKASDFMSTVNETQIISLNLLLFKRQHGFVQNIIVGTNRGAVGAPDAKLPRFCAEFRSNCAGTTPRPPHQKRVNRIQSWQFVYPFFDIAKPSLNNWSPFLQPLLLKLNPQYILQYSVFK